MQNCRRKLNNNQELEVFSALVAKVLCVPKAEILRREADYQKIVDENQNRRGPKRKTKPSASPGPVETSHA